MQLNTKKLWPTVIFLMLIGSAHADSQDSPTPNLENCPPCFEQNSTKPDLENRLILIEKNLENCLKALEQKQDINGLINPPAMPLTRNGWDLQVSADALFWQVQEDALTYAIGFSSDQDLGQSAALVKQKYNWGFRVGLDWTLPHDNWDIAATWTHLISNSRRNKTAATDLKIPTEGGSPQLFLLVLQGINDPIATGYAKASSRYHNRLDQVSLNIAREFFISKWVVLRPYFGLRSDWLHQRLRTNYSENVVVASAGVVVPNLSLNVTQTNKWQGIGIESGFGTQLNFCGGFSIYGNIAAAIEYGLQKLHLSQTGFDFDPAEFDGPANSAFNGFGTKYHICRPILDLQLGLGWDYNFCDDRFHFGLKLGWENHVYFNQSRFLFVQIADATNITATTATNYSENAHGGDLTYQGWTLHASFDF
ncbi:MAG: Lpg1974 family pore-forming outer membrane protein [Candidatus Rhabdochlamydia sp.]